MQGVQPQEDPNEIFARDIMAKRALAEEAHERKLDELELQQATPEGRLKELEYEQALKQARGGGTPTTTQPTETNIPGALQTTEQATEQPTPTDSTSSVPSEFRLVPTKEGKYGTEYKYELDPGVEAERKITEAKGKEEIKTKSKIAVAQRNALSNLSLIGGSFREGAQIYADAVREGGMGSKVAQTTAGVSTFFGGEQAERFKNTTAWPGWETEIISRIMPMLTQQGEKPGSVRLVSTVFDRLRLTVPKGNTPPKNARVMMEKTLRNMHRFSRAAMELGITNEMVDSMDESQQTALSAKIEQMTSRATLTSSEETELENLIASYLQPIDELIAERDGKEVPAVMRQSQGEGVVMEDANGNKALVNPNTMEVIREL